MKIKLLALDMDGTAYHSGGDIIDANIAPIKKLMEQGIEIVFLTGRPIHAPQNRFDDHGLIGSSSVVAGHNGAVIYHLKNKKVLYENPISAAQAHKAFKLVKEFGSLQTVLFGYVNDFKTVVMNIENPEVRNQKNLHNNEMDFINADYKTYNSKLDYKFFKFLVFGGNERLLGALEQLGFNVASNDGINAEVNAPETNKGTAIKWLSNYYKIKPRYMMAIGDGANDLPMMFQVKHSVSLENSIVPLKKITKHKIHLTNEEGGVGYAINHLILRKKGLNI